MPIKSQISLMVLSVFLAKPLYANEPGLISGFQSGMPAQLWVDESIENVSNLILNSEAAHFPQINRLRMILILSKSNPSLSNTNSFLLGKARLNYLWRIGALDGAESLAELYSWKHDGIRSEVENIALLSTRPEKYCEGLNDGDYKGIEPGIEAYCLARFESWGEAVEFFKSEKASLPQERSALLERFLDLDNEEDPLRDQAWIVLPSPIDFVLDEAIGRPRGLNHLPPAYAYFSRESGVTQRTDLEITEELVHLGSLPPQLLFVAYRAKKSAESGGAWGRAEIVQKLDKLGDLASEDDIHDVVVGAFQRFSSQNLLTLFAHAAHEKLSNQNFRNFRDDQLQEKFIQLGILGGWSSLRWVNIVKTMDENTQLAFKIRHPNANIEIPKFSDGTPEMRIIKSAYFSDTLSPLESLSFGEAIWSSLYVIDHYNEHPEHQVASAFQSLILAGQDDEARQIAITLLLNPQ